jgi:predicted CXXCH cytochrome family protein
MLKPVLVKGQFITPEKAKKVKKQLTKRTADGITHHITFKQKGAKKMKRWLYLIVAVAFLAGGILGIALAQADKVTIDDKYPNQMKGPVTFNHKVHSSATACTKCHHTWKQEASKTPPKCADCHKAADTSDKGLKKAYHKLCIDCHKDMEKQGKKAGPTTKCSDCHAAKK